MIQILVPGNLSEPDSSVVFVEMLEFLLGVLEE